MAVAGLDPGAVGLRIVRRRAAKGSVLTSAREAGGFGGGDRLLAGWLGLSIGSLVAAGIFALLVALTRTPAVQLLQSPHLFRMALVGHVIFALLVWFTSFTGALWVWLARETGYRLPRRTSMTGLGMAVAGAVLLALPFFAGAGEAYLNDYVPVIDHPLFWAGLVATGAGVNLQALAYLVAWRRGRRPQDPPEALGLAVASVAVVAASLAVAVSLLGMDAGTPAALRWRALFWGGGHILQFVYVAGMASAWLTALRLTLGGSVPFPRTLKASFFGFLPFIVATFMAYFVWTPVELLSNRVVSWIAALGLGAPTLLLAVLVALRLGGRNRELPWPDPAFSASALSLILFAVGGLMGLFGFHNDLRVPAHYHGMVGAVTLAYMGLTPTFLALTGNRVWRPWLARVQPYFYGAGVLAIMLALHWAGAMGAPRKTHGFSWASAGALAAMNLMGIGALLAILGGLAFVLNMGLTFLSRSRSREGVGQCPPLTPSF